MSFQPTIIKHALDEFVASYVTESRTKTTPHRYLASVYKDLGLQRMQDLGLQRMQDLGLQRMLGNYRAGLRLRSVRRRLRSAFVTIFAGLWLILEPAGLFLPDQFDWGWSGYAGLLAISALAALVVAKPPREVSRSLPPTNVKIEIRVGDVLAQQGKHHCWSCRYFRHSVR